MGILQESAAHTDFHIVNASLEIPLRISFRCLPAYLLASIFSVPFLKQFEKCDFVLRCFREVQFIYLLLSTYIFINMQLLCSKITPAQNLLSLNEEEGL